MVGEKGGFMRGKGKVLLIADRKSSSMRGVNAQFLPALPIIAAW